MVKAYCPACRQTTCGAIPFAKLEEWGVDRFDLLTRAEVDPRYAPGGYCGPPAGVPVLESPIEEAFWRAHLALNLPQLRSLTTQHPVGPYRLDLALPTAKVAIELDGYEFHTSRDVFIRDRRRQRWLEQNGWRVIRFAGSEVHRDAEDCVRQAAALCQSFWESR